MIAVFTGTRQRTTHGAQFVREKLEELREREGLDLSVLVGNCPSGIDYVVRIFCKELGVDFATFNALWKTVGKRAGPRRNSFLIRIAKSLENAGEQVHVYYYAPAGAPCYGTTDCVKKAKAEDLLCHRLGDSVKII